MCLTTFTKYSSKATKDIVCYKYLIKRTGSNHLESPYTYFHWDIGKEYTADRSAPRLVPGNIKDGYFHSYEYKEAAEYRAEEYRHARYGIAEYRIVKCIIPKGSRYYKGIHTGGEDGYASKKIKIVEVL